MNLVHDLSPTPEGKDDVFHVLVDIPKGSSNKYEIDEDMGYVSLDRVLYHQMFYPFDYGSIPMTLAEDGDPVDVCVMVTYPTVPGCVHRVRVIGMLETADEAGVDPKILAVPIEKVDPRWAEVKTWEDLPEHVRKEIHLHFKEIKKLEGEKYPKVEIGDFKGVDEAMDVIQKAIEAYNEEHKK